MFALAVIGIVMQGSAVLRTWRTRSTNERMVSLHLLSDTLGWAAVLAGSVVIYFTGLEIIDPLLSLAIVCFIFVNIVRNLKRAVPIILQSVPAGVDTADLAGRLGAFPDVAGVHDLHIWALDEEYTIGTVHLCLKSLPDAMALSRLKEEIRAEFTKRGIQHATIEFDITGSPCELAACVALGAGVSPCPLLAAY
jgi:cobalt-zinc-cadmium efflux system protein